MSKVCENCGKRPATGNNVSYSQRKTKRRFLPNLVVQKIWDVASKTFLKKKVCTRCLRTLTKKI